MKSLFLITLLLISFTAILSKETKNIYKCASDLKVDTCYFKDYQSTESLDTYTYYVNACPKGKYCIELSDKGNEDGILVNQCMKKKHYLDEGDKCAIGSECKSGVCTDNKCVTYEEGHTCSSSKECKTGLYCKTNDKANACTKYLKKGDSCKEGKCRPGLECANEKCMTIFSLKDGEKTDNAGVCISGETTELSSGGQSGDVFFRFHLRCRIQSPEFDKLRKNLINTECVESFKEIIWIVGNIFGVSVFCHDVCDVLEYLKAFNIKFAFVFITLCNICFK